MDVTKGGKEKDKDCIYEENDCWLILHIMGFVVSLKLIIWNLN